MRQSIAFFQTQKNVPKDVVIRSQEYLIRAGFIHQLSAGLWTLLPLGFLVYKKIEQIIREEMLAIGGQEILMPAMQPKEIWEQSGRFKTMDPPLFKLKDRHNKDFVLAPTHEEVITSLAKRLILSYKQLPQAIFQIQLKFRNEQRYTGGLLRVREFIMKDLYTLDIDQAKLNEYYQKVLTAYKKIFHRCGVPVTMVEANAGSIGGSLCHEFMALTDVGEDKIIVCRHCGYSANKEQAKYKLPDIRFDKDEKKLELVETENDKTISDICKRFRVLPAQALKAVFYKSNEKDVIFVIIRGDREVNEVKLKNILSAKSLRLASKEELQEKGLIAGAASPINLKGIEVVADHSIKGGNNFIVGANVPKKHYRNANYPRDFKVNIIDDITFAKDKDLCIKCGHPLSEKNAIEVGHIFQLQDVYSKKLGAFYIDQEGNKKPVIMGCYGIGLGRLLATIAQINCDNQGLIWPKNVAPFVAHLIVINSNKALAKNAEKIYNKLLKENIPVLYDDRVDTSPGVKFADADLLGLPYRLVISPKTKDKIEIKQRNEQKIKLLKINSLIAQLKK